MPYGIANTIGQPDFDEAVRIMSLAFEQGINTFDTARAYGVAEDRIGQWRRNPRRQLVNVITKIPPVQSGTLDAKRDFIIASTNQSRAALGFDVLPLVLMHRAEDLLDGDIRAIMAELVSNSQVESFGASLYSRVALRKLLDRDVDIAAVQLPINAADQRYRHSGTFRELKARGAQIYGRSTFLQGALLMPGSSLPDHLSKLRSRLEALDLLISPSGLSRSQVLLKYVQQMDDVDSIVVGVESASQLMPHVEAIGSVTLSDALVAEIEDVFSDLPEELVDPSRWPQ